MAYLDEPPERPLRVQIVGCIGGTQRLIPDSLPVLNSAIGRSYQFCQL